MPATRVGYGPVPGMMIDPALIKRRRVDPVLAAAGGATAIEPPTLQPLQTGDWPTFANDAERTIAINNGTFDPNYDTPLQKRLADSISADRTKTSNALIATQQQQHPLASASTPEDILAAQLAGDRDGTIKKIIMSHQPIPMDNDPNRTGPVAGLQPYVGHVAPNAHGIDTVAPLDYDIIHHPEFAKTYQKDPKEGARVYQTLTGRSLADDTEATKKLVEHHMDFRRATYEKNIANGSKMDPNNPNGWLIRQAPSLEENTSGIASMSTAPKRSEYRPATDSENDIMNSVHKEYSSGRPTTTATFTPSIHRSAAAVMQRASTDPKLHQLLIDRKTAKGGDLNPMEVLHIGVEYEEQNSAQGLADSPASLDVGVGNLDLGPSTARSLMRASDFTRNILGFSSGTGYGTDEPAKENSWGSFWKRAAEAAFSPNHGHPEHDVFGNE